MQKIIHGVAVATKVSAGCLLGSMTIMVAIVILGRYINLSVPWADELARIFFIWSALLGAASATYNKMHFSVSFVTSYFNKTVRLFLTLATSLLIILVVAYVFVAALQVIEIARIQILPGLQISKVWLHLSVIVSCCLMFIFAANQIILDFMKSGK